MKNIKTITSTSRNAFTLVEIMIVVVVIGILSAIAISSVLASQETAIKNTCLANMKQLEGVLAVAAPETNVDTGNLSEEGIRAIVEPAYMRMPNCTRGAYSTDDLGSVHCSAHFPDA